MTYMIVLVAKQASCLCCGSSNYHDDCMTAYHTTSLCLFCSWRLVEAAQGIQNALPNDKSVLGGLNEATYLAQQANAHGLNVMRLFGIADVNYNEGSPLQPSPGQRLKVVQALVPAT